MDYMALNCIKINWKLDCPWEEKDFVILMEPPGDIKCNFESSSQNLGFVSELKKQQ